MEELNHIEAKKPQISFDYRVRGFGDHKSQNWRQLKEAGDTIMFWEEMGTLCACLCQKGDGRGEKENEC